MEQQSLSIQDRIKALQLSKDNQLIDLTKLSAISPHARRKARTTQQNASTLSPEEETYAIPSSNARVPLTKVHAHTTIENIYQIPSAKPVVTSNADSSRTNSEHYKKAENDSLYDSAPKNTPVEKNATIEGAVGMDVQQGVAIEAANSDGVYSVPSVNYILTDLEDSVETSSDRNTPPNHLAISSDSRHRERTIIPENIGPRWRKVRQTVNDRGLRRMVDMSALANYSSVDAADLTKENKRNNMADFIIQSPITPMEAEESIAAEDGSFTNSLDGCSPTMGGSRQSSYKSAISYESGQFSDDSDATSSMSDYGRPRNISNVSITCDEDNYISFKAIDVELGDPIEKVLVTVKGNKLYTGRLLLASDDSKLNRHQDETSNHQVMEEKKDAFDKKSKSKSKIKAAIKALKTRKFSNISPDSSKKTPTTEKQILSRSLPTTPAKSLLESPSPTKVVNKSQGKYPNHSTLLSPHRQNIIPDGDISDRFVVAYPRLSSTVSDTVTEDNTWDDESSSVYCEPSKNTTPSFVTGENQDEESWYSAPLSLEKRSRSLANLSATDSQSPEIRRMSGYEMQSQFSESNMYDDVNPQSSSSAFLHPKHNTLSPKVAKSESTRFDENKGISVTMRPRNATQTQNKHRSRPPSMPAMVPPSPPHASTITQDEAHSPGVDTGNIITKRSKFLSKQGESEIKSDVTLPKTFLNPTTPESKTKFKAAESLYHTVDAPPKSPVHDDKNNLSTQILNAKSTLRTTASREPVALPNKKTPPSLPKKPRQLLLQGSNLRGESLGSSSLDQVNNTKISKMQDSDIPVKKNGTISEQTTCKTNDPPAVVPPPRPSKFRKASSNQESLKSMQNQRSHPASQIPTKSIGVKELSELLSRQKVGNSQIVVKETNNKPGSAFTGTRPRARHLTASESSAIQTVEDVTKTDTHTYKGQKVSPSAFETQASKPPSATPPLKPKPALRHSIGESDSVHTKQKIPIKRPTTAPPPRPSIPPPPPPSSPPDSSIQKKSHNSSGNKGKKSTDIHFMTLTQICTIPGPKAPPPSRPPPPSRKNIQAATERRIQRTSTVEESEEDEYHDVAIQGEAPEIGNIYACIDDDDVKQSWPIKSTEQTYRYRNGGEVQKSTGPKRIFQFNPGMMRTKNPPKHQSNILSSAYTPTMKYQEESLYVGIDDLET